MDYFLALGRQAEMELTKNIFKIKIVQCNYKCNGYTSRSAADSTGAGDVGQGYLLHLIHYPDYQYDDWHGNDW